MHRNLILFILITISFIASCEEGFDLNTGITLSEQNELYSLELNVSNNVTDDFSPVHFNAKVKRHAEYNINSDSRILGSWTLYSLTIDAETTNVAQFPTNYLFYTDQTFDKTEISTVGGDDLYSNGVWTIDKNTGTMTTTMAGETTTVNFTFDHNGYFIPMDGFMVWDYDKNGYNYHKILQKMSPPDPVYLSVSSSGGTIESLTEPSAFDITIHLSSDVEASYKISGSFVPGLDYSEGNILATLSGDHYSVINVNIPISIEIIY
ncbi:uncharacterized protein METZ01_LOCUS300229 [marine metagenome]|uniref:Uncharacterized protein n=1 Tax=marine metagenome TaxID=408172 RepID=A0A382MH07_9ZZZZ